MSHKQLNYSAEEINELLNKVDAMLDNNTVTTPIQPTDYKTINIKDYGAKGDGQTNDTSAFRAAIADAKSRTTIELDTGVYRIENLVIDKDRVTLKGISKSVAIKTFGADYGIKVTGSECNLQDFDMVQENSSVKATAILLTSNEGNNHNIEVDNISISYYNGDGIRVEANNGSMYLIDIERVKVFNVNGNGIVLKGHDSVITNCNIHDVGLDGVISMGGNNRLSDIKAYYCCKDDRSGAGILIDGQRNLLSNIDSQENYGNGFIFDTASTGSIGSSLMADANGITDKDYSIVSDDKKIGYIIKAENIAIQGRATDFRKNAQEKAFEVDSNITNAMLNILQDNTMNTISYFKDSSSINLDFFNKYADNDDDRLLKAFNFCRENKLTLNIDRKVVLTKEITYDFSFSIAGNGINSEIFLNSDSVISNFFIIEAPRGVVTNTEIKNITFNANKKANKCVLMKSGRANRFSNVTIKYAIDKDFQIGYDADNKVIELNCDKVYCIGGEQIDGAPMSNYNLYIQGGSSDNNFIDIICMNAKEANILEEGWSNSWTNVHCYGYPYQQVAKTNFYITGCFNSYSNIQCDTFTNQAMYIQAHYLCFNNIKIQTTLDLYPEAGGIYVFSENNNSSDLAFNNVMFKRFRTTDTEEYPFDIKFDGPIGNTIHVNNLINSLIPYENRVTTLMQQ